MARIVALQALEILDSRGTPTLQGRVELDDGSVGIACVPSGASVGTREAHELRDGDHSRYHGKGVLKAVGNVNLRISDLVVGMDCCAQASIDEAMIKLDDTPNRSRLGANSILVVSLAVARAAALSNKKPLYKLFGELYPAKRAFAMPTPMFNILNGGAHAFASTDFQEFMVLPVGLPTYSEALRAGVEIFYQLGRRLADEGLSVNVGLEGGYAPSGLSNRQALEHVTAAIEQAGYRPMDEVCIAIDVAASEFFNTSRNIYHLASDDRQLSAEELLGEYVQIVADFPVISIEDGFAEDDWPGWSAMSAKLGKQIQIVGDDLFVTQQAYLKEGIRRGVANAILIKLNQVGTLSETLATVALASRSKFASIISHRSGETEDTSIADLAVGVGCGQIKTGAPSRGERTAKYNRLLEIERDLGASVRYAGRSSIAPVNDPQGVLSDG